MIRDKKHASIKDVKKKSGFTVLEVMTVLIIIGMLITLVTPNMSAAMEKTRMTQAKTTMLSYNGIFELFLMEEKGYPSADREEIVNILNDKYLDDGYQLEVESDGSIKSKLKDDPWGDPYEFEMSTLTGGALSDGEYNGVIITKSEHIELDDVTDNLYAFVKYENGITYKAYKGFDDLESSSSVISIDTLAEYIDTGYSAEGSGGVISDSDRYGIDISPAGQIKIKTPTPTNVANKLIVKATMDGTEIRTLAMNDAGVSFGDVYTNITLRDSNVRGIESGAFKNYAGNTIELPLTSLEYIESGAFENSEITIIVIPDSVNNIYDDAFLNCTHLETVYIMGDSTVVSPNAFNGCSSSIEIIRN